MDERNNFFDNNLFRIREDLVESVQTVLEFWDDNQSVGEWTHYDPEELLECFRPHFEEDEYFNDEVDETNYNPYLGCNEYDTGGCEDWGW